MTSETLDQETVGRATARMQAAGVIGNNSAQSDSKPVRQERSDKGTTRGPFVDIDDGAVRYDLSKEAGRAAFKIWAQTSEQNSRLGLDHAIAAIASLLKKHGAEKA